MTHIIVRNAAQSLSSGLELVLTQGQHRPSRNGPVMAMDAPVTITYQYPNERVIFAPERDANPFFHLFECLWMLNGQRDVGSVAQFVPGMRNYSDDGKKFNGAYGYRWRKHFGVDQIQIAVDRLRTEGREADRRTYITMFDPKPDTQPSLDIPCNVGIAFRVRSDGELDMTVFNRSNDLVLGMTGANVVHMSFLHELVAQAAGLPLGQYHQVTNDLHMYVEHEKSVAVTPLAGQWGYSRDHYANGTVEPFRILDEEHDFETWMEDLEMFLKYGNVVGLRNRFFRRVAAPVIMAHTWYKDNAGNGEKRFVGALEILEQCLASDWKLACEEWIQRRYDNWKEKTR